MRLKRQNYTIHFYNIQWHKGARKSYFATRWIIPWQNQPVTTRDETQNALQNYVQYIGTHWHEKATQDNLSLNL